MKQISLFCLLLLSTIVCATKMPVDNTTIATAITNAADGDTLLLSAGTYATGINFQNGKVITLKSAGNGSVVVTMQVSPSSFSATNCGLVFDGLVINRGSDNFIYADVGNVKKLAFNNDTIMNVNRCILRTPNAGYTIDTISFNNCIIKNCGSNGYNFIYPKHLVKNLFVTNSTLYNYTGGESLFYPNQAGTSNVFNFVFENNTVYKWGKDDSRALCNTRGSYSTSSTYTFRNNIITEPGVTALPKLIVATGGTLTAEKNLVVNYGTYVMTTPTSSTINDLSLAGLGLTSIGFGDAANGVFSILSSSPLATASTKNGIVGDPRWLKVITSAVTLSTATLPAGLNSVSPAEGTYNVGDNVTLTAAKIFGYKFKEWRNSATNTVVSTVNPYSFTISGNTSLVAVYETLNTYSFTVSKSGSGGDWGVLNISPAATNGRYEEGTMVTVTAASNKVSNFLYWEDASTSLSRTITVNSDVSLTATYDQVPFIVGWDFKAQTPTAGRSGDYYAELSNSGIFSLNNQDGSQASWLASSSLYSPALPGIRMWSPANTFATPRYYQATFSTVGYKNIRVESLVGASYHAYPVITLQYSTNGVTYTELNRVDITSVYNSGWIALNGTLPDSLNAKSKVYIRWMADVNSTVPVLGNATDVDGTGITNVFVFADKEAVNDPNPPVLVSSVPTENSTNASANGAIILTFDERVKAGTGNCNLGATTLAPVFGSKTVSFSYTKLDYNTNYTFTIPAGALTDISGNAYPGLTLHFRTMNRPQPAARLYDAVIAKDGSGDYTTIQAAIDAMPTGRTAPWLIFIKNGVYNEIIRIGSTKPFIHFIGQDKEKVKITFAINCSSGPSDTGWAYNKGNYGMEDCACMVMQSSDFYAENISFENKYGVEALNGPMALAIKTYNDRFAFYNCKMRSYQDTWQTTNVDNYRHYAYKCHIEGAVDYIYNNGNVLIEQSTIYNVRAGSVIVAPAHKAATTWGYVFKDCTIDGNAAAQSGGNLLGRPWHDKPQAVYINTKVLVPLSTEAWTNMGTIPKIFAEYNSYNANGQQFDLSGRKKTYSYTDSSTGQVVTGDVEKNALTDSEAAQYTYENVIMGSDGWNPRAYFEPVAKPTNVQASGKTLSWTKVDYAICYVILRNDSVIGFSKTTSFTDNSGLNGTTYTYKVKAANEYGSIGEASDAVNAVYTSVKNHSADGLNVFVTDDNEIHVSNTVAGDAVALVTIDGKTLLTDIASGSLYTKKVNYPKGVYILKVNNSTFKIKL